MIIQTILERGKDLKITERRTVSDSYLEIVFWAQELTKWEEIFNDLLGLPAKPPGIKPDPTDQDFTRDYGGICQNQTLFKKDCGDCAVMAMLWPWQDGQQITLKVSIIKKAEDGL